MSGAALLLYPSTDGLTNDIALSLETLTAITDASECDASHGGLT